MASTLDFIKEKFPKLSAFSDPFIARSLYKRNFEDVQDEFDDEEDYIAFLLQQDTTLPDVTRFGKQVSLEEPPEEQAGILETIVPSFKAGIASLEPMTRGVAAGVAGEGEFQEEQLRKAQIAEAEQAGMIPDYIRSWRDIGGVGDATRYFIQKFGESSPWLAGAVAGGVAGSLIFPGAGTIAGMGIGAFGGRMATMTPMHFGQNILRQSQEVRAGRKSDINELAAFGAAVPQAFADSLFLGLIGKYFGKAALAALPSRNVIPRIVRGGAEGAIVEGVTEATQQMLERAQAGLPLDDEEALREYEESFVAGATLGGVISGTTAGVTKGTLEEEMSGITQKSLKDQTEIEGEAEKVLTLTEEEKIAEREIGKPIPIKKEEEKPLEAEQINQLRQEGAEDGKRLFIGDQLTEKIQGIIDTRGEQAAREYYDAFSKEFLVTRRTKAPAFEAASKKVKRKPTAAVEGQKRFGIDEVSTDQF